jgi:hypothetical protein
MSSIAFFNNITPEHRSKALNQYKQLLKIENDGFYKNKDGKIIKIQTTPWMIKHWEKGLEILTDVMIEKKELENNK